MCFFWALVLGLGLRPALDPYGFNMLQLPAFSGPIHLGFGYYSLDTATTQ